MEIVENSPIGSYVLILFKELIIQIFLKYIRIKSEEAIEELTAILAEGKEVLGYNVDETSKKVNSMIFNTILEAKKTVKYNIKAGIRGYKDNLVNKFKETFKKTAEKGKEEVNKFIDSIGNTSDSEVMKTNLEGLFSL